MRMRMSLLNCEITEKRKKQPTENQKNTKHRILTK